MRISDDFAEFACECQMCGKYFISVNPDTVCRECEGREEE